MTKILVRRRKQLTTEQLLAAIDRRALVQRPIAGLDRRRASA